MNIIQVSVYLVIITILVQFIRKRKNKRFYQLLEQFPSIPAYPLIGNAHLVLLGSFEGILERCEKVTENYDRLLFWMGPKPVIVLKKSEDIAVVLNQSQNRNSFGLVDKWLGFGILTIGHEDEWKRSRKMLAPAFSSVMLSKYVQVFNKWARELVQNLKPVADAGKQIDVEDWTLNANLGAAIENTMGITVENCGKSELEFCHSLIKCLQHALIRMKFPILMSDYLDTLYLKISGKIKAVNHCKNFPTQILKKKLNDHQDFQHQNNGTDGNDVDSSKTMIDLLIKNHTKEDGITETRMRDELLQTIAAGVETSSLAMSFTMLMLAMHQDAQQKAYEEIVQLTADDETITEDHLINHLVYLEQCIRETMRMYSPVMTSARYTHKEIILNDKTIIPAGVFVIPSLFFANYDPELYKNPDKWDPEHYSEQAINGRPKTSQITFGYGPRNCIGGKYAMMSVKTQMAYILRNYHLSTNITEFTIRHLKTDLGIRSKIGYPVKLTSRREIKMVI